MSMLKIREFTDATGQLAAVYLRQRDGALEIVDGAGPTALPAGALVAVMSRYGAPFDPDEPIAVVQAMALGEAATVRHVRHLSGYDVIARDYLVYEAPGAQPLCALSATVARALEHLAAVVRARSSR